MAGKSSAPAAKDACAFFTRTGACPHGTACKRKHLYPRESSVIVWLQRYRPTSRPPLAAPNRGGGNEVWAGGGGTNGHARRHRAGHPLDTLSCGPGLFARAWGGARAPQVDEREAQAEYDEFFDDMVLELARFGTLVQLRVNVPCATRPCSTCCPH